MKMAPAWFAGLFSARARAHTHRFYAESGCVALSEKLRLRHGNQVLNGPFQGLALGPLTYREHLAPYLLGTYERELNPTWDEIFERRFSQILDIGAKFGYYAVGLARRFPETPIIAFDTDSWARRATREVAQLNAVHNVTLARFCGTRWLERNLRENAFILSDCEGYEATLFSADIAAFRSATLLIETHESVSPGVTGKLRSAFAGTHAITEIPTRPADSCPPEISDWPEPERKLAVNEHRSGHQSWLYLTPREARQTI